MFLRRDGHFGHSWRPRGQQRLELSKRFKMSDAKGRGLAVRKRVAAWQEL
jgi:hypothetical protein